MRERDAYKTHSLIQSNDTIYMSEPVMFNSLSLSLSLSLDKLFHELDLICCVCVCVCIRFY